MTISAAHDRGGYSVEFKFFYIISLPIKFIADAHS